jgi:hypothetical protein
MRHATRLPNSTHDRAPATIVGSADGSVTAPATGPSPQGAKRPRDERLDFFRGLTMLIIFVAHLPENSWNAFIPARFGFSSGAELFVFCSGIASALAFGSVFVRRGLLLGTARIAYRIWQVYWAQLGLVLALIALATLLDRAFGLAELARQFPPLLSDAETALLGLATLTWQPDYLDILPMYLVILALVPVDGAEARPCRPALPDGRAALRAGLDSRPQPARQSLEWSRLVPQPLRLAAHLLHRLLHRHEMAAGAAARRQAADAGRHRLRPALRAALLLGHPGALAAAQALRELIIPEAEKTNLHILRVLHFLALAYLVLSLIEPWRRRLDSGAGHLLILIGRQSLATFLASVVLARLAGTAADWLGRGEASVALLNLAGFALILTVAVIVGWFKSAPWAGPAPKPEPKPNPSQTTAAGRAGRGPANTGP